MIWTEPLMTTENENKFGPQLESNESDNDAFWDNELQHLKDE